MKRVLSIVVLFISVSSFAQNTFTAKNTFNDTIYYKKNLVSASSSDSVLVKTAGTNGYLALAPRSAMGISSITADNGLTASTSTNVQLGGTLGNNTAIATGAFTLTVSTSTALINPFSATSTTGKAIIGTASSSGSGVYGSSSSGSGGFFTSTTGDAVFADISNTTTNAAMKIATFRYSLTSGTPSNGIGTSINFDAPTTANSQLTANSLKSIWTDATTLTRTSQFIITGVNSGVTNTLMTADGSGKITMSGVGSPVQTLSVTNANGDSYGIISSLSGAGIAIVGSASDNGVGVDAEGTTGVGLNALVSTGVAVYARTSGIGGLPGRFYASSSNTNSVQDVIKLETVSTGTSASGFGGALRFDLTTSTGVSNLSNKITSVWIDATNATRTSQFEIWGVNSGTSAVKLIVKGSGVINIATDPPQYANNAAAITGGLVAGDIYRNGDVLQIVH